MSAQPSAALAVDWTTACRRAADGLRAVMRDAPTSRERVVETGERGEGGDQTLVIDELAEDAVFSQLERLHDEGARFTAVSEERGIVDFGDPDVLVVIDPIDGSMNAKRGLSAHALSVAVADGHTMADVVYGYVLDLGVEEEWIARRGEGAWLNDAPLPQPPPERRMPDGRLEVVALESAHPRWVAGAAEALCEHADRFRALGAIAVSLCQVALTRVDGMATLWRCRSVDAAAAQLIVRESGGLVEFPGAAGPLDAPLDLEPHAPVIAARSEEAMQRLRAIVGANGA
ncbi:MAG TPA: inositol monophosphatase family protein [Solirubrobacteraceae bacterium]|nr:inositol monophosphatase family protein [Solirubrobacteraceae bacterium]